MIKAVLLHTSFLLDEPRLDSKLTQKSVKIGARHLETDTMTHKHMFTHMQTHTHARPHRHTTVPQRVMGKFPLREKVILNRKCY